MDSPTGASPSAGDDTSPETDRVAQKAAPKFSFPLPFDPIRILGGVLSRWPWIALGLIVFGVLGAIAGIRLTRQSFAIDVSLIKRRVPHTVQASETGQAYRPVDLNDATLLATLTATEPLDLAIKRAKNGLDPAGAHKLIEAKQLEGTDIFYLTYHSPFSPEDAVNFSLIWAEEINAYTQRLQRTEAHEVRLILQREVSDLETQINATNREILNFSKERDYFGGDAQISAVLTKLSQVEIQLESARSAAVAKEQQLKALTDQLKRQSPSELQLKTAKEELANLRATYTDANPLVQAKLQSLEYLASQANLSDGKEKNADDLEAYTGTPLGNQLYLDILEVRSQMFDAKSQVRSLERLEAATNERISDFPAIISGFDALGKKRDAISTGLTIMSDRLKEAEIFASGAPGYWQVFEAPDGRQIIPSSKVKKPALLGIGGGLLGAGLMTLFSLLLTHRSSRRSILECCSATKAPLIANLPHESEHQARLVIDHFWITHLAPLLQSDSTILFWTAPLEPQDERKFWTLLASAASADASDLSVRDLTPDEVWTEPIPSGLGWSSLPSPTARILRASSLPHGEARDALTRVDCWLALVDGTQKSLRLAAKSRALTDVYLPPCNGTIAWTKQPKGHVRQAADVLSLFLAKRFS